MITAEKMSDVESKEPSQKGSIDALVEECRDAVESHHIPEELQFKSHLADPVSALLGKLGWGKA